MIKDIQELNFPPYATLASATVNEADMGDKTITATIKIDGQVRPKFTDDKGNPWEVRFKGERYILPVLKPQASKDNTDIRSSVDLTFRHWAVHELQRFFFVEMAHIESETVIPDKYEASLSLNLNDFIIALNKVLDYWYDGKISAHLHPKWEYAKEPTVISISYTTIWDLLTKVYETYACRWQLVQDPDDDNATVIVFGYPADEIDHIFEYGFKGGLLKIERQVQSNDIRNVLLERGGEKNVPYRYFKKVDPQNDSFTQDPDWIPELKDIPFDRIRDAAFRSYVQGWKYAHRNDPKYAEVDGQFITVERSAVEWAYLKGASDKVFDPVEFVADKIVTNAKEAEIMQITPSYSALVENNSSIAKYGVKLGALSNNDDIFPTIQGLTIDPYGRIDQVVAVSEVVSNEEGEESSTANSEISEIKSITGTATHVESTKTVVMNIPVTFYSSSKYSFNSSTITIPDGKKANFNLGSFRVVGRRYDFSDGSDYGEAFVDLISARAVFKKDGKEYTASALESGTYTAVVIAEVKNNYDKGLNITLSFPSPTITIADEAALKGAKYANTFDIWVKNIWQTQKGVAADGTIIPNETDEQYAERVWRPILGDREEQEARIAFTTGMLAMAEDYEFKIPKSIATSIHYDTSKIFTDEDAGVQYKSEWRITLACSDADFDTLGVLIPNSQTYAEAGDYFIFLGIDLPYLYYTEAEKRLTAYKQDELDKIKDINPTWVVSLDKVRLGRALYDDIVPIMTQIKAGDSIRLTDPRFTDGVETLYVASVSYKYKEPANDDPAILADMEVVLSDEFATTSNPIGLLQGNVNALQKQIGSLSNIEQIVRIVGDRLYLRKDGLSDLSYSPTQFNSLVTSKDFRIGAVGGAGWGVYRDANGSSVIEADRFIVRQDFEVNNLVINQILASGGIRIESAASMEVSLVVEGEQGFYCYFDQKQGTIANLFQVDDVAYCSRWDADNNNAKYYKARVTEVGVDYIFISSDYMIGNKTPEIGDTIVQYGNYTNANRRFVIIRDVVGGGYESFIEGLNSVTAVGSEYWFVGKRGTNGAQLFIGNKKDDQYIEYLDNKLNIPVRVILQSKLNNGHTLEEYIDNIRQNSETAKSDADALKYIKDALENGATVLQGGLILSSLLQLGYLHQDGSFRVMSGLNGIYDDGNAPAFWAGGNMIDAESKPDNPNRATAMIRMDGTGYMAGNTIRFKDHTVELGDNIVLSDGALTLATDSGQCIRIANQSMPDDLAKLASNPITIDANGNLVNMYVYGNGAIQNESKTQSTVTIDPVTITSNVLKDVANLKVRIAITFVDSLQSHNPTYITAQIRLSNSSKVYNATFHTTVSENVYEAEVQIQDVVFDTDKITITATLTSFIGDYSGEPALCYAIPYVSGTRQSVGNSMTLIGSNGFLSSWPNTAMGINKEMAIMRAYGFGVLLNMDGIKIMWNNVWRDVILGTDNTLKLN